MAKKRKLKKSVYHILFGIVSVLFFVGIVYFVMQARSASSLELRITWEAEESDDTLIGELSYLDGQEYTPAESEETYTYALDAMNDSFDITLYAQGGTYSADVLLNGNVIHSYTAEEFEPYITTEITHPEAQDLDMPEYTLAEAIEEYSNDYLLLFATISDNTVSWGEEEQDALISLGFENTPLDTSDTVSWIARYYQSYAESYALDGTNQYQWTMLDHTILVTAVSDGDDSVAFIVIDGDDLSYCYNGLNMVVYDIENDEVIDSLAWDYTGEAEMVRNAAVFYTVEETTVDQAFISEQIQYAHIQTLYENIVWMVYAIILFIAWLTLLIRHIMNMKGKKIHGFFVFLLAVVFFAIVILTVGIGYGYQYLESNFPGVSFNQLLYHLRTNLTGTNLSGFRDIIEPIAIGIGIVLFLTVIYFIVFAHKQKQTERRGWILFMNTNWLMRWTVIFLCLVLIMNSIAAFWNNFGVPMYFASSNTRSTLFENYYVNPAEAAITFPSEKKNLIYIYLESMEVTESDIAHGGIETDGNHIEELTELGLTGGDSFNGDSDILQGGYVLSGTGWTIAGMIAQTAGVPLTIQVDETNNSSLSSLLPGAYSIGEVLEANGYHNILMIGSDADFGNRSVYFETHGNYEICDYYWAIEQGYIDEDYYEWWGYEDAKLFEYAKLKAQECAESGQPFNLTLLTADTHFPEGYLCDDCPDEYEDQYSNVFACSSARVAEFVEWVNEQEWGKDTVIVLAGDHTGMDARHNAEVPDGYERTTYVSVINSSKTELDEARIYSTMDLYPTTLSALGCTIEGDRLGLGTDLYSETPTLIEQLGEDYLNAEIERDSEYYETYILN